MVMVQVLALEKEEDQGMANPIAVLSGEPQVPDSVKALDEVVVQGKGLVSVEEEVALLVYPV